MHTNLAVWSGFSGMPTVLQLNRMRRIARYKFTLERAYLRKRGFTREESNHLIMEYRKLWITLLFHRDQPSLRFTAAVSDLWRVRCLTDPNYAIFCSYLLGGSVPYFPEPSVSTLRVEWLGERHWLHNIN